MAELGQCVLFEWGWPFLTIVAVATLLLIGALIYLAKFFGLNRRTSAADQASYLGLSLKGSAARFLAFIVVVGGIIYVVYLGYDKFHTTYSVSFDTASAPSVNLETLRSKFQGDTQATVILSDRAKNFSVSGHYKGACTPALFESICRQHSDRLSCKGSWVHRTMTVDVK